MSSWDQAAHTRCRAVMHSSKVCLEPRTQLCMRSLLQAYNGKPSLGARLVAGQCQAWLPSATFDALRSPQVSTHTNLLFELSGSKLLYVSAHSRRPSCVRLLHIVQASLRASRKQRALPVSRAAEAPMAPSGVQDPVAALGTANAPQAGAASALMRPRVSINVAQALLRGEADKVAVPATWAEAHAVFWQHPTAVSAVASLLALASQRVSAGGLGPLDGLGEPWTALSVSC